MALNCEPAQISTEELQQIKNLEHDIGRVLLAVEPATSYAMLSETELAELQETEKRLGCVMLAYKTDG